MQQIFFIIFSAIAVQSAFRMIRSENVIHGILWMVVTFFSTACLFVLLRAEFIAAMQVLVYAGAIVILYVFAVMLVNLKTSLLEPQFHHQKSVGFVLGGLIFAALGLGVSGQIKSLAVNQGLAGSIQQTSENVKAAGQVVYAKAPLLAGNAQQIENGTKALGQLLYTEYVLPFEIVSLILLVAIVGAVVLVVRKPQV